MTSKPGPALLAIFAFALPLLFVAPLNGQPPYRTAASPAEISSGYLPYRRLVLDDFRIDDSAHREKAIYTAGFFHYRYQSRCETRERGIAALVTEWIVYSGFDRNKSSRKSWFRAAEKLLEHEQGHLGINELHSRGLANLELRALPVGEGGSCGEATADLKKKLEALAARCSREAQAEQDKYDRETGHGKNALKQEEATSELKARLSNAGIIYPDG